MVWAPAKKIQISCDKLTQLCLVLFDKSPSCRMQVCSQTTHKVSNSSKIIPRHIPNRHTPTPSIANAGSDGWSLFSTLEELLSLNILGKLARICKTNKMHEIYFTYPHEGISNHSYYKVSFFYWFCTYSSEKWIFISCL